MFQSSGLITRIVNELFMARGARMILELKERTFEVIYSFLCLFQSMGMSFNDFSALIQGGFILSYLLLSMTMEGHRNNKTNRWLPYDQDILDF